MAELQKILQASDVFKPDWMQAILTTDQQENLDSLNTTLDTSLESPGAKVNATPSSKNSKALPNAEQATLAAGQQEDPDCMIIDITEGTSLESHGTTVLPNTEKVSETPSDSRRLLIDFVTDAVVDAHTEFNCNTHADIKKANRKTLDMPDISKLSLSTTMWQKFLSSMAPEITKVVKFCTKLPGFSEMDQEDQSRLIKQGTFEVMVAKFVMLIDEANETMLDPSLKMKSSRAVVQGMALGPFVDQFFEVARLFNPLRLMDGEVALFIAILMISPTRQGLNNVTVINVTQQLYLQALYCLMKRNHTDVEKRFSSLINMIPVFRKINEDHQNLLNNIRKNHPEEFNRFPNLHKEVFEVEA